MKLEDISKEKMSNVEFVCPVKGNVINFPMSLVECRVQIADGKFANAQLGVLCGCGYFHLTDLIPTGFLVIRGKNSNWGMAE